MVLHEYNLDWYVQKLKRGERFGLGMYGDGEWQAIFRHALKMKRFTQNCEATVYDDKLCEEMAESLKYGGRNFLFSAPDTFKVVPEYFQYEAMADASAHIMGCDGIEYVEKNVWNKEMKEGGLWPLIEQLRKMPVYFIGNAYLRGLTFLKYKKFFEIGYPNCYLDGSFQKAKDDVVEFGKPGVYLIAAGIPAALMAQHIHKNVADATVIDTGSIWDGFVGIGGQRSFRHELYQDEAAWQAWAHKNIKDDTAWDFKFPGQLVPQP